MRCTWFQVMEIFTAAANSNFESLPPLEHLGGVIWAVFFWESVITRVNILWKCRKTTEKTQLTQETKEFRTSQKRCIPERET